MAGSVMNTGMGRIRPRFGSFSFWRCQKLFFFSGSSSVLPSAEVFSFSDSASLVLCLFSPPNAGAGLVAPRTIKITKIQKSFTYETSIPAKPELVQCQITQPPPSRGLTLPLFGDWFKAIQVFCPVSTVHLRPAIRQASGDRFRQNWPYLRLRKIFSCCESTKE